MNWVEILLEISAGILFLSFALSLVHLYQGPMIMDRINALNLLGNLTVGVLFLFGFLQRDLHFFEIALILCLVSFIPIVVISHFLVWRYGK